MAPPSQRKIRSLSPDCELTWRRDGAGWIVFFKRRRMGRVLPDAIPGLWRSLKPDGQLSKPANLSWAKNAVLVVAERELEFEHRSRCATDPPKRPQKATFFTTSAPPVEETASADTDHPATSKAAFLRQGPE